MSSLPTNNPFVDFVKKYRNDPKKFVTQVLKAKPDPWQEELLEAVQGKD